MTPDTNRNPPSPFLPSPNAILLPAVRGRLGGPLLMLAVHPPAGRTDDEIAADFRPLLSALEQEEARRGGTTIRFHLITRDDGTRAWRITPRMPFDAMERMQQFAEELSGDNPPEPLAGPYRAVANTYQVVPTAVWA